MVAFLRLQIWGSFAKKQQKAFIYKGLSLSVNGFNSCRPHQNRVIMQNKRINTRFFCIFDRFMHSKIAVFHENRNDWRKIWRNIGIALSVEFYKCHLPLHKVVGEMCIYSINKLFRAIAHPKIHDVRACDELLTS